MDCEKLINSFEIKKKISHLIIYGFQVFIISRSTETLIVLNFWLEVYT